MIGLLNDLRDRLEPTCDVEGCDGDPEPVLIVGQPALLCFDHTIEALREIEGCGGGGDLT